MGKAKRNSRPKGRLDKLAHGIVQAAGSAKGTRTATAVGAAIVAGAGTARATKPKPKSEKKRKSYWDEPVDRVLREHFPDNSATNFKAKVVVKKVREVLKDEIRESGLRGPSRGLILRKSGHWKS